uniref:ATP synthase F0 subunit 6 n=1 Tax=Heliconema longissimum TaxID=657295 RepID=G4V233_9BILA|nr:ATP synthase F0 subunit 6 [Heliconema longissimum]ACV96732.1 ATP synthase F0 subunit 6 [Heliconema longissimum]
MIFFFWAFLFIYLFYMEMSKVNFLKFWVYFLKFFFFNFSHQGWPSNFFFKIFVCLLCLFWFGGMFFPLYSPWASVGFLFFMTTFSWLSVRLYTLLSESFFVMFEFEHSWDWFTSLIMFFSDILSYVMSGLALCLRISIIFSMGHFLMFVILGFSCFTSFFFIFIILPIEMFFALLQSYIFLTLIWMFLSDMN